jgi:hypothetical protein
MPNFNRKVLAVMLAGSFAIGTPVRPAQSNPAGLAPALCATGAGCVLVGTVVIAGGLYYVWEFQGGKKLAADAAGNVLRMLQDPEREMERMADPQSETVIAGTRKKATERCRAIAKGRTLQEVRHYLGNQWECVFY